ncbi:MULTISPECIES: transketolase C-terminal domain-containing protein [unclassified Paenibacillus]|uniref:transketolase family protein n=1 Tax=unclassified Paenibacillus TaxID=185978 RepID=UPI001AE867E1|nr:MULTISPECIES: transketolase C-terminal domain-containing protein [unclassified Paenibacillus]MBP1155777.1 transketolase [Paenibacillus sp. PvP091]MBP1168837.1 transketolase [Paenibacillus sp. PvR098]MBP2439865.1 transketolase [Paenibacillus sp. PvP052]
MAVPLHEDTWELFQGLTFAKQLTAGETLARLGEQYPGIVALCADLGYPTRLADFGNKYPDRFFDFGIAEKNMVSAAAGLATTGKIPFVATYASFLGLLCCEQIRTDIAYPKLKVRLIGTHTGIAMGFYGSSHHATEDIAIIRSMANMTVISPADGQALSQLIEESVVSYDGPIYFRVSRGREDVVYTSDRPKNVIGKANVLRQGEDLTIIACGITVKSALDAAEQLNQEGLEVRVLDMHTIKPLDQEAVFQAARETGAILTVEEHNIYGGLGGAVAEVLMESGIPCKFKRHGIMDQYSLIGKPYHLYHYYKLDGEGIASVAREIVNP